jgi:predicted transglutaminase-like cysteine proteinase
MKTLNLIGLASLLMLGACASTSGPTGLSNTSPFMPTGVAVNAPVGFMQMCETSPDLCAAPAAKTTMAVNGVQATDAPARPTGLLLAAYGRGPNPSFLIDDRGPLLQSGDAFLRGPDISLAPVTDKTIEDAAASADLKAPAPILDQAGRMALLNQVNRRVNGSVRQVSDVQLFGSGDHWRRSGVGPGATGDCKDLAVEKRMELIAQGFPAEDLFLAIVFRADLGYHALLIARTDSGDMVLDSRSPYIVPWNEAPYIWVKRQSREDPTAWSLVAGPPAGYADLRTIKVNQLASNSAAPIQPRFQ